MLKEFDNYSSRMLTILKTTLAVGSLFSKDQQVKNHSGCGDDYVL
jgi:hypothetical protein